MKFLLNVALLVGGMIAPSALYFALHGLPPSPYLRETDKPMEGQPLTSVKSSPRGFAAPFPW